jgi:hypothetical protein
MYRGTFIVPHELACKDAAIEIQERVGIILECAASSTGQRSAL